MVISKTHKPSTLHLTLYSGMGLIVISMLFLGRQQQSNSFLTQALMVLGVPALFYGVGMLTGRYLRTPLAAPGLIATGAWLVGVGLIHLYNHRVLLPEFLQAYYWLGASLLAGVLISVTGHRVRIWMLVPLVPLVQINGAWAVMSALGVEVKWMPALTFLLVLGWWEAPLKDERWVGVYRVSGVLLTVFVLLFSLWLPLSTSQSLMLTWGSGASLVALLGVRHGWRRMGPLAIGILFCASLWGLPAVVWPLAWVVLGLMTILFIEIVGQRETKGKDGKALEICEALAVLLCGGAALAAQIAATFEGHMPPIIHLPVLVSAGILLLWLGWRRGLLMAVHLGLWLTASAWALVYFIALPGSHMFGLWLALWASGALLIERVLAAREKEKLKSGGTMVEALVRWPVADLVIGLSAAILLWITLNISSAPPQLLAMTCALVVGLWLAAGLSYRLPVLLHVALWIAPLPYGLLLLIAAPAIWTLPLMGTAWQILGAALLLLGHGLQRYRPAILAPFFIVGYFLVGFGFSMAVGDANLLPFSLGIVIIGCIVSSIAVIADHHPLWSLFLEWALPKHRLPYAYQHFKHLFLFLSAWLAAIWLHLMLGYTGLGLSRQGMFLVACAGVWFVLGRMLGGLPDVVSWPVSSAGWLMWVIGLLEVFFSPTEAIITMIFGLAISGEALRRSRSLYWIPIFIVQVLFTALQVAWTLHLPGTMVLMNVAVGISVAGMVYERRAGLPGRAIAATGGVMTLGICALHLELYTLAATILLLIVAAVHYRRWETVLLIYGGLALMAYLGHIRVYWWMPCLLGTALLVIGAELVKELRPRRYRTLNMMLVTERDWATPFLWGGLALLTIGWGMALTRFPVGWEAILVMLLIIGIMIFYSARLRIRGLPYLILTALGMVVIVGMFFEAQRNSMTWSLSATLAVGAVAMRWWGAQQITRLRPLTGMRWGVWWLRPLLGAALFLSATSTVLLTVVMRLFFSSDAALMIGNGLLLMMYAGLVYRRTKQIGWLGIGFLMGCFTWVLVVNALKLEGVLWYSIPAGTGLLALAQLTPSRQYWVFEVVGVACLMVGAVVGMNFRDLTPAHVLVLGAHSLALVAYGYFGERRIPFMTTLTIMMGGLVWAIFKVNVWLIPLSAGVVLLAVTILAEAQGDLMEAWIGWWIKRWREWK